MPEAVKGVSGVTEQEFEADFLLAEALVMRQPALPRRPYFVPPAPAAEADDAAACARSLARSGSSLSTAGMRI